jgi:4-nitrophenyl phosphatase
VETSRQVGPVPVTFGLMTTWALDLDGVIWSGTDPIAGSSEAVADLRAAGRDVVFVTNNSFATIAQQEQKLASFGIDAVDSVISSAQAAASLVEPGERVLVLGGPGVIEALGLREAELIDHEMLGDFIPVATVSSVVVGLDWHLDYHRLSAAVQAILAGARFIATNTDATYPSERGLLPGAGAIVAAVAAATGQSPIVAGKPEQPVARLVRARFGDRGIMVGDRPETDGAFAEVLGYDFGLVLSGVTTDPVGVVPAPDVVAEDLAGLVAAALAD